MFPLGVVRSCPLLVDRTEGHAAQRMTSGGMENGEIEVPDEQEEHDVHQTVVEDDCAREAKPRVPFPEPEEEAGDQEQHRERGRERCIQLLTGVEATLWRRRA